MAGASQVYKIDTSGEAKLANGRAILQNDSGTAIFGATSFIPAGTTYIYTGACTTRDTVRAEVGLGGAIGSVYFSSAGKIYLKVANADATADWAKVTSSAAD